MGNMHPLVTAMPELLRSAKSAVEKGLSQGRNETYVKQLSDYIIPALVEALRKVIIVFIFIFICIIQAVDNSYFLLTHFYGFVKFSAICMQEPDTEICANMLDALNECLQVCAL